MEANNGRKTGGESTFVPVDGETSGTNPAKAQQREGGPGMEPGPPPFATAENPPTEQEDMDTATQDHWAPVQLRGGGAVLLVEDIHALRRVIKRMLSKLGLTVFEAEDGVEALEVFLLHQNEIALVLCDLTMPGMDGWQTLGFLRRLAPDLPVILSSGYNEGLVMGEIHGEQPDAFLPKPYSADQLRATIVQVLSSP